MRKILSILLILALSFAFSACGKEDEPAVLDVLEAEAPAQTEGENVAATAGYGRDAKIELGQSAAYIYEGPEGITLYGAVEYTNTGDCPVYISKASFSFSIDGTPYPYEYAPALGEYMVVLPGETSFAAAWISDAALSISSSVSLAASLTPLEAAAPRVSLKADGIYVADNYPGFSTLSGRLVCERGGCAMNTAYVGFYDEAGAFLGAFYCTKNAVFEEGDAKSFVVNMRDFPLSDLGARAVSFKTAAFGFDLQ